VDRVPIATAAHELSKQRADGISPLDHALSDGEDFELILAVQPEAAERILADQPLEYTPLADVGEFIEERGLWRRGSTGHQQTLKPSGYEHILC